MRTYGHGDTPYLKRGVQIDPKAVFNSDLNLALKKNATIVPGYGYLPPGTLMSQINEATTRLYQWVPYAIQDPEAGLDDSKVIGAAYLVTNGAASAVAEVTMEDSYKFAVGDHIGAVDSDATPIDMGAITAIDRSTYTHKAVITASNDMTTAITVAAGGMIFIQTQAATPFVNAVGCLTEGVDTGVGAEAEGANGVIAISHYIVRTGMIPNYDSGALTDLGGVALGNEIFVS